MTFFFNVRVILVLNVYDISINVVGFLGCDFGDYFGICVL